MIVSKTIADCRRHRAALGRVAFVPTMGALHEGHLSLIRRAKTLADAVVVSIFVNPAQFAPHEDLDKYPRPVEADLAACEKLGVDLAFNPGVDEIYPPDELPVSVEVPALGRILEGEHRPHFFGGVCRVVAKLFHIVQPDIACFGRKDYQQLKVIEAMVAGLAMPIRIEPCDTLREPDGLAMSSRNIYLDAAQRERALSLSHALKEAAAMIGRGATEPGLVERSMQQTMASHDVAVDYATVRDARTLGPIDAIDPAAAPVVLLVAGRVDRVRLIDNRVVG